MIVAVVVAVVLGVATGQWPLGSAGCPLDCRNPASSSPDVAVTRLRRCSLPKFRFVDAAVVVVDAVGVDVGAVRILRLTSSSVSRDLRNYDRPVMKMEL